MSDVTTDLQFSGVGAERLRVGLLLDSLTQPRWAAKMLDEIRALPFVDIPLVVLNAAQDPARGGAKGSRLRRLAANRKRLLHAAYKKWDARRAAPAHDAFTPTNLESRLEGAAVVRVLPRMTQFCDHFEDSDVESIRAYQLDVAVRLGFRILKGRILTVARYGVWSYHHGDNLRYRGGPAGFWEVAEGNPVTGSILQILSEELDAGRVIHRSFARTDPSSVASNRNNYYWKTAAVIARKLRQLHELGPTALAAEMDGAYHAYSERLYTQPTNVEMARALVTIAGRQIRNRVRCMGTVDQGILAYKFHPGAQRGCSAPLSSFYNFKTLEPPRDRSWSDPFPVLRDGRYYLFFAEHLFSERRTRVAVTEFESNGNTQAPRPVLERAYDLSYPFLFDWGGTFYLVPATPRRGAVELYRCISFPDRWEFERTLLEGLLPTGATLVEINGRWWMFVTLAQEGATDADDELHLFQASTPLGPWTAHPRNPVKTDVRGARPAGGLFRVGDRLYRPSRNYAAASAPSITIHRVVELDEERYREEAASRILPRWKPGLVGTQTLNAAEGLTALDGVRRRRSLL